MTTNARQILDRAIESGWITRDQAAELARIRHQRKLDSDTAPAVDELAVELGYLTADQARQVRSAQERFDIDRELDGYRLIERIGAGTMGVVYRARQLSLDRVVAIKVLSPHLAGRTDYVDRFLKEARTVAKLNHPNVISGIDVGEAHGLRYFVMEYAEGTTVGQVLKRGGAMDESRVARVAMQIARALEHAHDAGLVHRDIKPDNILVTKDGVAKLCDLGLAKDRPEAGRSLGTPAYISPEQARGVEDVDIRSDLYSFGCTLYHMLTGRPPFEGNPRIVMVHHLSDHPTPIRELEPDVSAAMEEIVETLMRKEPDDRYPTPRHLVRALDEYENARRRGFDAAPPPPSAPSSPRSRTRRRRR